MEQDSSSSISSSSAIAVSSASPSSESIGISYGNIPRLPTQEGPKGIRFDFNSGLRLFFPEKGEYHLKFWNADTNVLLYDSDVTPNSIVSATRKYYIRYRFEVTERPDGRKVVEHTMDLSGRNVVVQMPVKTLGDSIGWFSYLERFQRKTGCRLHAVTSKPIREIFERQYPEITFVEKECTQDVADLYATYYIGLFFKGNRDFQPIDFRYHSLHRQAAWILGLRSEEELADIPPRVDLSGKRPMAEKYVTIATKASAQCKLWNHPLGWEKVIDFLRGLGYKVVCIDKERVAGRDYVYSHLPWGVEDWTGDRPLQERIDAIANSEFFIGLGSGLSWLAWCCKVPVVLISGFSLPQTEFYTPYRIINYDSPCIGCWDDTKENFDHKDYFWCPRQNERSAKYQCTKLISPEQVIGAIKGIPVVQERIKNLDKKKK